MAEAVIVFDNVHKSYRDVKALDGVSFDVAPSTCFGLLGRNGAGKSTIMRLIYRKAERDPSRAEPLRHSVSIQSATSRRSSAARAWSPVWSSGPCDVWAIGDAVYHGSH